MLPEPPAPPIVVPELRDYQQINAELVRRLNLGERHVRLEGVAGQRLLVSRIAGAWRALIEVDGNAGPELAAELDAPDLTVVCRGERRRWRRPRPGGWTALHRGRGRCGHRLFPAGRADRRGRRRRTEGRPGPAWGRPCTSRQGWRLAGERQAGGRLFFKQGRIGPHAGHGRRAGRLIALPSEQPLAADLDQDDYRLIEAALRLANCFFPPA